MSKSSRDQGSQGPRKEGNDQPDSGPKRRGMHPEDEELITKPLSRQDEMMHVAIAAFLGLFVVSMALAQSRQVTELIPEPQFVPRVTTDFTVGSSRRGAGHTRGISAGTETKAAGPTCSTPSSGTRLVRPVRIVERRSFDEERQLRD